MPERHAFVDKQRGILHIVSPDGTYEMFKDIYQTKEDASALIGSLELAVKDGRMEEYVITDVPQVKPIEKVVTPGILVGRFMGGI